jgi:hypothetical protein
LLQKMSQQFGLTERDASFTNLVVQKTLTAGTVVASSVVTSRITATEADVDVLKINGQELTVTADDINRVVANGGSGGSGGGGGGPTIVVPGLVTQILTSSGSGQILAPGSTVDTNGSLNLTTTTAAQPKIQLKGTDFLTTNVAGSSLTLGNGSTPTIGTNAQNNIVVGCNAGLGLGTGSSDGGNVVMGTDANIPNYASTNSENVLIGHSAIASNITQSVVIGAGAGAPITDTNNHSGIVIIGRNAQVNESADTEGTILIGQNASSLSGTGQLAIGQNTIISGNKFVPSTVIGTGSNDTAGLLSTVIGSTIVGAGINCAQGNCICLGTNATTPTADNQLTLPSGLFVTNATLTTPVGYIVVQIGAQRCRLPLYTDP